MEEKKIEEVRAILTKMYIEEYHKETFQNQVETAIITKSELIRFCMKLLEITSEV